MMANETVLMLATAYKDERTCYFADLELGINPGSDMSLPAASRVESNTL